VDCADRVVEARALYLKYRGQQAIILEDFAEFQKAGLTNPLMQDIEKAFAGSRSGSKLFCCTCSGPEVMLWTAPPLGT